MNTQQVQEKRRNPWLTLFSFIFPGIGHVYCGKLGTGLIFLFLSGLLGVISFYLLSRLPLLPAPIFGILLMSFLVINLIAGFSAFRLACKIKPPYYLKVYNQWYVYLLFLVLLEISSSSYAYLIEGNIIEAYRVPTVAMFPTIIPYDRILGNKIAYKTHKPQRGDIVIFPNPEDEKINFVKRVVAIENDTVEIRNYEVYVNGRQLSHRRLGPMTEIIQTSSTDSVIGNIFYEINENIRYKIFIADKKGYNEQSRNFPKTTIPPGSCFVLGDDRTHSLDSRWYGSIALAKIKARVDYIYWPADSWSRFGTVQLRIHDKALPVNSFLILFSCSFVNSFSG